MNNRARINGQNYTLLEIVPSLDGADTFILCVDEQGEKRICPEQLWRASELQAKQTTLLNTHSSTHEKIALFLSLFQGRENLYAKRYHSAKTGESGYTPVCKNEWAPGVCDKKKHKCPDCPNREFLPLVPETAKAHLIGRDPLCRDVVAIYLMLEDNTIWLLEADFDEENWRSDVSALRTSYTGVGLTSAVERSRSENGIHV